MAQTMNAGPGRMKESNADQALGLLGVGGDATKRAKDAANAYINRSKAPKEEVEEAVADDGSRLPPGQGVLIPIPEGTTPQQAAEAPPAVQALANATGQVPKEYVDGVNQQQAAIQKQQKAEQEASKIITQQSAQEQMQERSIAEAPPEKDPIQTELDNLDKDRARQIQELKEAKIEPKNYWSGKSTWQKIVGGIGLALSSLTPQGAQNAIKIIDDEITRDIEIQKSNIASKRGALEAADKRYADLRGRFKDEKAADLAERGFKLDVIKVNLQEKIANANSAEAQKRLQIMDRQLDAEIEKNKIALAGQIQKLQEGKSKGEIPGYAGVVTDQTEARGMREAVEARSQINGALKELEDITKTTGRSFSPSIRAAADQKVQLIQLKLKELLGLGVLSEADDKRLREIIDNPARLFSLESTSLVQQKGLREFVNKAVEQKAKGLGLQKIQPKGLM